jgi:hypothetical protein
VAEARGTTYGEKVDGGDGELRLVGSGRRRFGRSWVVDLAGISTRFRRDEGASPEPVFNYNLLRLDGRVGWSVDDNWLLSFDLQHSRLDFPGRFVSADTLDFETESQRHWSAAAAAVWRVGDTGFVTGEVAYRSARSNLEAAEYAGPILSFRTRGRLARKLWLSSYVSLAHRRYHRFTPVDSLDQRADDTWQIGLTLERPLTPRIRMFLDGTFLHQVSNFDEFDFDQSRVGLGVTFNLLVTEPRRVFSGMDSPYTPVPVAEGIRFRYPDTGAEGVSLVGGFNNWSPEAAPLEPDRESGYWEIVVPVPPGRWRYAFVVDGEWVAPPGAPRTEEDGFGGVNGILEVQSSSLDPVTGASESRPKD